MLTKEEPDHRHHICTSVFDLTTLLQLRGLDKPPTILLFVPFLDLGAALTVEQALTAIEIEEPLLRHLQILCRFTSFTTSS